MLCEDIENRILDDQMLTPAEQAEVETHLAGCAGCRLIARQFRQLDSALSAHIKAPALSSEFDRRLRQRIQAAPAVLTTAELAERKRQLQAEFEEGMSQIGRVSFSFASLRKYLTKPLLAVIAACLAWLATARLTALFNAQSLPGYGSSLLPWLAASAVFLAVGLAEAFSERWRLL